MCFKKRPSFSELWLSFLSLLSGSSFLLSLLWSPSITLDSRSDSFSSVWGFVLAKMHWLFCFKSRYRVQCVPSSFRPYLWLLTLTLEGAKTLPVSLAVLKLAHYSFQGVSVTRTSKFPCIHTGLFPTCLCFGNYENTLSLNFVIDVDWIFNFVILVLLCFYVETGDSKTMLSPSSPVSL